MFVAVVGLVVWKLSQPQYKNDDYGIPQPTAHAPQPPEVKDPAEWDAIVRQNVLYQQTLDTPVRCELPDRLDPTWAREQVQEFLQQQVNCLHRVWGPVLDRTGKYTTHVPTVTVYDDDITTACGKQPKGPNNFYCRADQQLYFSMDLLTDPEARTTQVHPAAEQMLANSYAHLLQGRAQINDAVRTQGQRQKAAEALEANRRKTLQADCYAGMYLAAVAQSRGYGEAEVAAILAHARAIGDDNLPGERARTHGTGDSRAYWTQLGMSTTEVGKCNTFVAPPDLVR